MNQTKPIAVIVAILCAFACLGQRLSIVSNGIIEVSESNPAYVKTISIDYCEEAQNKSDWAEKPYQYVYNDQNFIVKINGIQSNQSFSSLVEPDNALLLLVAENSGRLRITLNPRHDKGIQKIELEFKSPVLIGKTRDQADISQAEIIFKNWGMAISQNEYDNAAKCLDILKQNNRLVLLPDNRVDPASKQFVHELVTRVDLQLFPGKTFKSLVDANFFTIGIDRDFSEESCKRLAQAFYYTRGLIDAKKINIFSDVSGFKKQLGNAGSDKPLSDEYVNTYMITAANKQYHKLNQTLIHIDPKNKTIRDTIINSNRYILMLAWKSGDFYTDYVKKPETSMPYYVSMSPVFAYPLFLAAQYEIEHWAINNKMNQLTDSECSEMLMQVLGLPPNSTNSTFVEFWVNENDLFRPVIDMSETLSPEYVKYFSTWSNASYNSPNIMAQYPFTGCGYTYDYNPANPNHKGVSEFVLKESRTAYVRRKMPTKEYINSIIK